MTTNVARGSTPIALSRVLLVLAAAGFALGGIESVVMRGQLARAGSDMISAALYHQILTLHGVSLLFLCALPATLGLALGLLPARVAAGRDAFPRLAAFGVWVWVAGAVLLHVGLALGGTSGAGMLGNASMTSLEWAARDTVFRGMFQFRANGVDWWATALAFVALGATCVTIDLVATLLLRRAPNVKLGEFTPFTWNMLLSSALSLIAFPALFVALVLLQLDRLVDLGRFVPETGADPTLWPRLTALLGHPQIALLLMPAMGLAGECVAQSAGRPMHGRAMLRLSTVGLALAGLLGWIAQATPAGAALAYALLPVAGALMAIASGIAVFHWLATLFGRAVHPSPALSFALGMAALIMTGAFSTLPLAFQPAAARQVGTYFGVAHAHEMLFGGVVLGLVAGLYQFLPRITGRALDAHWGQIHFALTFVGAAVTFLPMHVLGLAGMPRRIHTYLPGMGWDAMNAVSSAGALVLLLAGFAFVMAIIRARPVTAAPEAAPLDDAPMWLAGGLALLACGTLLGWIAGIAGIVCTVIGAAKAFGGGRE